jgi:hexosaminidase
MAGVDRVVPVPVSVESQGGSRALGPATAIDPGEGHGEGPGEGHSGEAAEWLAAELRDLTGHPVPLRAGGDIRLRLDDGGVREAYTVEVTPDGITLRAGTGEGLFRAAVTLAQLVDEDGTVPCGRIEDRPRYPYRGLMLDVARHFFGVPAVKRVIDLAVRFKVNHLHLHLTDDQGWRIAIERWPRLTGYGGGTEVGDGPGGFYTQAEYRDLVEYARRRFVTIVPEIDLPGHTNAALASYPELTADGIAPSRYTGIDVGFSSLAVDREITYRFLDEVLGELAALTPGPYLHIGGDEAKTLTPEDYATIVNRAQDIVAAHGKTVIGWHEIAAAKLVPSAVVQYWGVTPDAPEVVAAGAQGNPVIMSPATRAYLDMRYDEQSRIGLVWAGHIPLEESYNWDPETVLGNLDATAIIGVEAPLWTETVRTTADIEYLMLPRLAAIAEIGWSPVAARGWGSFRRRLAIQASRWDALGVGYHRAPGVDWPSPAHE